MNKCELCGFKNPKGSVTAIIIKNNSVLMLKRNEEPFKDMWDFPGGYMSDGERPCYSLKREMKEELGVECKTTFIKSEPGYGFWKGDKFPVLNMFFLAEIEGDIKLNEENSEYRWWPIKDIVPEDMAFDSIVNFCKWLKENFQFDIDRVKELTQQLDSSAVINEQSLYKAVLDGYVSKLFCDGKLVGLGWIYPRQTMLRAQAVIEDMIVDNEHRGKKYGEKILLELIDWAKKEGVEVIELTSGFHRKAAHGLYHKHGFIDHNTQHMLLKLQ